MGKNVHYLKIKEAYCVFIEDVDNEIKNLKQYYHLFKELNSKSGIFCFTNGDNINVGMC